MRMELTDKLLEKVIGGTDENTKEKEGPKGPQRNDLNYIASIVTPETHIDPRFDTGWIDYKGPVLPIQPSEPGIWQSYVERKGEDQ